MAKVNIASLQAVVDNIDTIKRNEYNLISIRDTSPSSVTEAQYAMIDNAGLQNLLVVNFDDLVSPLPADSMYRERPPNEEDIRTILEWSKQKMQENNSNFIIQCTGGISRSSAVAILVRYLQDPEKAIKVINPILHRPNEKVLEIGEKLLKVEGIKDQTKEILKKHDE